MSIAALEREEEGLRSLPGLLAESLGRKIEDIYKGNDDGVLEDVELNRTITEVSRAAVGSMVRSLTGGDGRVNMRENFGWFLDLISRFGFKLPMPWFRACSAGGFTSVDSTALDTLFTYLRFCLQQICADMEMESLLRALDGEYILPGPGGDPIRNPGVLPSGKNIHALDPQAIPTQGSRGCSKNCCRQIDRTTERRTGRLA